MNTLGIDIGGSGIKGAVVDVTTGRLVSDRHRIATPQPATPEAVSRVVGELARTFDWSGPVGCAFPARIKHGVARTATNIDQAWLGADAADLFETSTGCPTVVLNDADAAGLAEMRFGAGRGRTDLVLVLTVGTGIGSALFIDGVLVPNTEFGHIIVAGKIGEQMASDRTRERHDLTWAQWAKRFQRYLERIEFLVAPDLIVLGGGVSRPKKTKQYLHLLNTEATIVPAVLENEAGIVGAACAAQDHALRQSPSRAASSAISQ